MAAISLGLAIMGFACVIAGLFWLTIVDTREAKKDSYVIIGIAGMLAIAAIISGWMAI